MFVAVFQSSLKINHHPQIKVGDCFEVEALAQILGCNVSDLPFGSRFKSRKNWNHILEKMERRLARWKNIYLSKRGRLTLIKSTLLTFPTYFFLFFLFPPVLSCKEIFYGWARRRI